MSDNTASKIAKIDEHLKYEFSMLMYSLKRLLNILKIPREDRSTEQNIEKDIFFEIFLLHARNLNQFFSGKPDNDDVDNDKEDNVLVKSFKFKEPIPNYKGIHGDTKKNIHKFLAHLTWSRTERNKPLFFECLPITKILAENLNEFINYMKTSGSIPGNITDSYSAILKEMETYVGLMKKGFKTRNNKSSINYHSGATGTNVFK